MKDKRFITCALIFGGTSREHEVSLMSAKRVYAEMKALPYDSILIGISRCGRWYLQSEIGKDFEIKEDEKNELLLSPGKGIVTKDGLQIVKIDLAIPLTHGKMGEDGILQGVLKSISVPYIGTSVSASAIGMTKSLCKDLARSWGIPTVPSLAYSARQITCKVDSIVFCENLRKKIVRDLGSSIVLKPDDEGSSIGVQVLSDFDAVQLQKALKDHVATFDSVLIETCVQQMVEVECAVFFGDGLIVSEPRIIDNPNTEQSLFLTYEQKYLSDHPYHISTREHLPEDICERIDAICTTIAEGLLKEGFARIDFFYQKDSGTLYFNEINTIPGLTGTSIFPVLAEMSGYPLSYLLDRLICRKLSIED
ncbi:MAG: hypothetical protein PQJ47_05790 [Sphaerochaetaceae bacterium]|nr:hypothetical protein [Sphaerochaetaceae bacterium]